MSLFRYCVKRKERNDELRIKNDEWGLGGCPGCQGYQVILVVVVVVVVIVVIVVVVPILGKEKREE